MHGFGVVRAVHFIFFVVCFGGAHAMTFIGAPVIGHGGARWGTVVSTSVPVQCDGVIHCETHCDSSAECDTV